MVDGWTALSDPTRRAIFELVVARPRPVREIADRLPVSQPAVSQHLKVLKAARLVVDRAEGTRRIYSANPDGLADLRSQLEHFWNQSLVNLKRYLEEDT